MLTLTGGDARTSETADSRNVKVGQNFNPKL